MTFVPGEGTEMNSSIADMPKKPHKQRKREKFLNKWQYRNDKIAFSMILSDYKTTELRNLGNLAYKIKCKWENQLTTAELKLEGKEVLFCVQKA